MGEAPMARADDGDAARPDAVMVFDGDCALCSGSVRAVLRMDRSGAIRFTPARSPYGRLLCARAGVDPDDPATFLFFARGRALGESEAVAVLLGHLDAPWRWLRLLRLVPRSWRDRAYRRVARHRYRLFGRACLVPAPHLRARFVEAVPGASPR